MIKWKYLFSFAGFKQPIRHEINKRAAALGNQLQKGFNTAAEVKAFHCESENGKMHPRYKPDLTRQDQFGFVLLDKFVSIIGDLPAIKGLLKSFKVDLLIAFLVQYATLPGIRSYHTIMFDGDRLNAKACMSPAIYYEENSDYKWQSIKIPSIKSTAVSQKRKSV